MATDSIFSNVCIKNKAECRKLAAALERAEKKKSMPPALLHQADVIVGEAVKDLFQQS